MHNFVDQFNSQSLRRRPPLMPFRAPSSSKPNPGLLKISISKPFQPPSCTEWSKKSCGTASAVNNMGAISRTASSKPRWTFSRPSQDEVRLSTASSQRSSFCLQFFVAPTPFVTITVTNQPHRPEPGTNDPMVPTVIYNELWGYYGARYHENHYIVDDMTINHAQRRLKQIATRMRLGGPMPWVRDLYPLPPAVLVSGHF